MKRIHSKAPLSTAAAPEDCENHFCRLNSLGSGRSWFHSWLEPLDTGLCLAGGIGLVFCCGTRLMYLLLRFAELRLHLILEIKAFFNRWKFPEMYFAWTKWCGMDCCMKNHYFLVLFFYICTLFILYMYNS